MDRLKQSVLRVRTLKLAIIAIILAALPSVVLSDVTYLPKSSDYLARIVISGQIRPDDLNQFIVFARMARVQGQYPSYLVRLNSLGGDVWSAIAIGRIVRLDKAAVAVLPDAKCFSSCVFILAGGPLRNVAGSVGIHRPFAPIDSRTTEVLQKQNYERLEKEIKRFLQAVNIPSELYDHMLRIPPQKVAILSRRELQRYGLSEDDPYEDAARDALLAKSLNITVEELIRRQARANAQCFSGNNGESGRCYVRMLNEGQ